ncbi:DUF1461 domain-containing protein [Parathalassolituus penaei]|uniref:DUF1461 domain-containing protein n=1 Tax=Parathalassolituus penaei TaxID=2997323 RepID=A0A9X3IS26_9GAMM|nr:DUF1461 domain-containing protein [Parathalassolituus penaei]MCY0965451.1 DUF1461 domain-containing protein [Parathalassolituus penaei]
MALIACLGWSWLVLAQFDYAYPLWYDWLDIGEHIKRFGRQNRFIHGLETLPVSEHVRLFADICTAVHNGGAGLADIQFVWKGNGQGLLRMPEIEHLQDVANLIDLMRNVVLVASVVAVAGLLWLRRSSRPRLGLQAALLIGLVLVLGTIVLIVGPKAVFYQFHVWIFPENHQWFFYYQESLMSTLMKAPDLFGAIAVAIVVPGLMLFAALLVWLGRTQSR